MPGLLLNGVDSETLGLTLGEAPGWLDMPTRDVPTAQVAGRQGVKALGEAKEGARRITLIGTARAATSAALRPKIDAIKLALLANPLTLVFGDNSARTVTAVLASFTTRSVPAGAFAQEGLGIEAVLSALDPYACDIAVQTIALGVNRLPLGTGVIRPVVTISGVTVNPLVTLFNTAGVPIASLGITVTNIAGDTLVIDMDKKTIKKNGVSILGSISSGDFFTIDPADQVNFGGVGPYITSSSGAGNSVYNRTWR
jgi:phage-related protein